jgi:hypothetical protein
MGQHRTRTAKGIGNRRLGSIYSNCNIPNSSRCLGMTSGGKDETETNSDSKRPSSMQIEEVVVFCTFRAAVATLDPRRFRFG